MIDTKAIRSKILDLALRGLLTEQLPEDGTAEELYQQIQTEKAKLIKEGKIKKEKPLPEITEDEKLFEIPESWKWVRWGDLSFQIQYGYNAPAKEKGRVRMVRITDIQNNRVVWQTVPFCDIDEKSIEEYLLRPNNILFARTGGTVGKSYLVENIEENAVFAGYLIRTSFSANLSAKYMKFFMESRLYWKQLQDGTTATAQPNCNAKTLSKMLFPLPPLVEQKRIVEKIEQTFSVLDTIDDLQAKYANNLSALKSKLIDAAIQGKLTKQLTEDGTAEELYQQIQSEKQELIKAGKIKKEKPLPPISEDEIPFEIPKNWKWVYLGNLFQHNTGKALNSRDREGRLLEYITTSNVYWDRFELKDLKKMPFTEGEIEKCTVNKGDLLVCEGGDIGRAAIWSFDYEMRIQNHIHKLRRYSDLICTEFYYFVLKFYKQTGRIDGIGIGLQGFSSKRVHTLVVPFPPLAEQKRIVERLEEVLAVCDGWK